MSGKMQVLFVKQTGHVLAAFTRTSDPEGKPKVSDLIGTGLLVRNKIAISPPTTVTGGEALLIDAESLDIAVVDFNADVFRLTSSFAAGGGAAESLGPVSPIAPTLAADKLTVEAASVPPDDLKVWALVEKVSTATDPEQVRRVMEGKIKKIDSNNLSNKKVELNLTIQPAGPTASIPVGSQYHVLILVAGQQPVFATLTLP